MMASDPENVTARWILKILLGVLAVELACLVLYKASSHDSLFLPTSSSSKNAAREMSSVFRKASMENKTIILTTLNEAWAAPNSTFDLFLESFKIGNNTPWLLKHLVVVALDENAYGRCVMVHPHCYLLHTGGTNFSKEAYFLSPTYLQMMWRRIDLLHTVLRLGYNFIFTDVDIMWLRNPFPHFYAEADFQIACDHFNGNSSDINNFPNGGFNYIISNNRTVHFYEFWYQSRLKYPGEHDQDVLNKIKHDPTVRNIGLKMRFLDTIYFGGFCEPSRDMNEVCTMHANCCIGLEKKVHDLSLVLQDWKMYMSLPPDQRSPNSSRWRAPQKCHL